MCTVIQIFACLQLNGNLKINSLLMGKASYHYNKQHTTIYSSRRIKKMSASSGLVTYIIAADNGKQKSRRFYRSNESQFSRMCLVITDLLLHEFLLNGRIENHYLPHSESTLQNFGRIMYLLFLYFKIYTLPLRNLYIHN